MITFKFFEDVYSIGEELGRGGFSTVRRVKNRITGEDYAAKVMCTGRMSDRERAKVQEEIRICCQLRHPNIVQLHETVCDRSTLYMVFEYLSGGELFDDIVAREFYTESHASRYMGQVLESVRYCHSIGIVHRDLKPENLILASSKPGAPLKLVDFGLAIEMKSCDGPQGESRYGISGSPGYVAPEVLKDEMYGKPVDVWACGVILYIMLAGFLPFWDDDNDVLFQRIKGGDYSFPSPEWDTLTADCKDLVGKMLTVEPHARVTVQQALSHPWIRHSDRVASKLHRQVTLDGLRRLKARLKLKGAIL